DVLIADSTERARELALPEAWALVESRSTGAFPPLSDAEPPGLTARQRTRVEEHVERTVHGTAAEVARQLADLVARTGAAELIVFSSTYDRGAQAESDAALARLQGS